MYKPTLLRIFNILPVCEEEGNEQGCGTLEISKYLECKRSKYKEVLHLHVVYIVYLAYQGLTTPRLVQK